MIDKKMIENLFSKVKKQTSWDLSSTLTWGFFFTSPTLPPLESAAVALTTDGYRVVECFQSEDMQLWLHVEKDETHSVASIFSRTKELEKVAKRNKCVYDGFNVVGPDDNVKPEKKKSTAKAKVKSKAKVAVPKKAALKKPSTKKPAKVVAKKSSAKSKKKIVPLKKKVPVKKKAKR